MILLPILAEEYGLDVCYGGSIGIYHDVSMRKAWLMSVVGIMKYSMEHAPLPNFCKRSSSRYMIYNLIITSSGFPKGVEHAVILLFDHQLKTVDFLDPNGPGGIYEFDTLVALKESLSTYFSGYKFNLLAETCPRVGIKSLMETEGHGPGILSIGYCAIMTFLILLLIIGNNITSHDAYSYLYSLSIQDRTTLIQQFICFLMNYVDKYKLSNLFSFYAKVRYYTTMLLKYRDIYSVNLIAAYLDLMMVTQKFVILNRFLDNVYNKEYIDDLLETISRPEWVDTYMTRGR